jgi:hypothetical protein
MHCIIHYFLHAQKTDSGPSFVGIFAVFSFFEQCRKFCFSTRYHLTLTHSLVGADGVAARATVSLQQALLDAVIQIFAANREVWCCPLTAF